MTEIIPSNEKLFLGRTPFSGNNVLSNINMCKYLSIFDKLYCINKTPESKESKAFIAKIIQIFSIYKIIWQNLYFRKRDVI